MYSRPFSLWRNKWIGAWNVRVRFIAATLKTEELLRARSELFPVIAYETLCPSQRNNKYFAAAVWALGVLDRELQSRNIPIPQEQFNDHPEPEARDDEHHAHQA